MRGTRLNAQTEPNGGRWTDHLEIVDAHWRQADREALGISLWPYAVPYSVTLWQAASFTRTLKFLDIGTIITLPIILAHLGYVHWTFRGKTRLSSGYGH